MRDRSKEMPRTVSQTPAATSPSFKIPRRAFAAGVAALLTACGGGGGGDTTTPPPVTPSAITVDASSTGPTIAADQLGGNFSSYASIDITDPVHLQDAQTLGVHLVRWPGGSASDTYHWQNNTSCSNNAGVNDTFANFLNHVVTPGNLDFAITLDYGTNVTCDGPGDPAEAGAWVAAAKTAGYTGKHWTVGNEVYGSWETDLHPTPHDAATYVAAMNATNGYYAAIKAADPTAQVGAVVSGFDTAWDNYVVANAKYDFLEIHYYAQNDSESDTGLLAAATNTSTGLASYFTGLRAVLAAQGKPANTPIFLGEFNSESDYNQLTTQSTSIVNGLYAGLALAEVMSANVPMATWWSIDTEGRHPSTATNVYGFQSYGTYSAIDSGAIYPAGRAYQLAGQFAVPGNHLLTTAVDASAPNVRAYAATQGTGYALFLFNLGQTAAASVNVSVGNATRTSFTASSLTYGKAQYDDSRSGTWTAPVAQSLGTVGSSVQLSLPAWSMTVVKLQ